jgi:hypothetical protein
MGGKDQLMMSENRIPGFDDHESIVAMRRRHAEIGRRLQEIAVRGLEELEAKVAAGEPTGLTAEEIEQLLRTAAELIGGTGSKKVN